MGYDLHITRKDFWANEEGPRISFDEWKAYLASDPDLQSDPENPGPENYVIVSLPGGWWPLWWDDRRGELHTKNPDRDVVAKLVAIARALNARVIGDDDEIYGVDALDPTICERR